VTVSVVGLYDCVVWGAHQSASLRYSHQRLLLHVQQQIGNSAQHWNTLVLCRCCCSVSQSTQELPYQLLGARVLMPWCES